MLSLFANPFTMIAGALLISSPIIIHLINRMRYKRVRFAAMEFLLKSQKRSRRKLIIEQMILLLLRILFCLLIGLLLARFTGCQGGDSTGASTSHIILIDDTLSTSDTVRGEDGQVRDVYAEAKRLATDKIAAAANQASSPQFVQIIRLSEMKEARNPGESPGRNFGRLNSACIDDMKTYLSAQTIAVARGPDRRPEGGKAVRADRNLKGSSTSSATSARPTGANATRKPTARRSRNSRPSADVHLLDAVSPERLRSRRPRWGATTWLSWTSPRTPGLCPRGKKSSSPSRSGTTRTARKRAS